MDAWVDVKRRERDGLINWLVDWIGMDLISFIVLGWFGLVGWFFD